MNNLTGAEVKLEEAFSCTGYRYLIGNYPQEKQAEFLDSLKPYESVVLLKEGIL